MGREHSNSPLMSDKVDIMFTLVGDDEPPSLPLKQEFKSGGIELVFNAKDAGMKTVLEQQKLRENKLLQRLEDVEARLGDTVPSELGGHYKDSETDLRIPLLVSAEDKKALIKERAALRMKLDANAPSAISYATYSETLERMQLISRTESAEGAEPEPDVRLKVDGKKCADDESYCSSDVANEETSESSERHTRQIMIISKQRGASSEDDKSSACSYHTSMGSESSVSPNNQNNQDAFSECLDEREPIVSPLNVSDPCSTSKITPYITIGTSSDEEIVHIDTCDDGLTGHDNIPAQDKSVYECTTRSIPKAGEQPARGNANGDQDGRDQSESMMLQESKNSPNDVDLFVQPIDGNPGSSRKITPCITIGTSNDEEVVHIDTCDHGLVDNIPAQDTSINKCITRRSIKVDGQPKHEITACTSPKNDQVGDYVDFSKDVNYFVGASQSRSVNVSPMSTKMIEEAVEKSDADDDHVRRDKNESMLPESNSPNDADAIVQPINVDAAKDYITESTENEKNFSMSMIRPNVPQEKTKSAAIGTQLMRGITRNVNDEDTMLSGCPRRNDNILMLNEPILAKQSLVSRCDTSNQPDQDTHPHAGDSEIQFDSGNMNLECTTDTSDGEASTSNESETINTRDFSLRKVAPVSPTGDIKTVLECTIDISESESEPSTLNESSKRSVPDLSIESVVFNNVDGPDSDKSDLVYQDENGDNYPTRNKDDTVSQQKSEPPCESAMNANSVPREESNDRGTEILSRSAMNERSFLLRDESDDERVVSSIHANTAIDCTIDTNGNDSSAAIELSIGPKLTSTRLNDVCDDVSLISQSSSLVSQNSSIVSLHPDSGSMNQAESSPRDSSVDISKREVLFLSFFSFFTVMVHISNRDAQSHELLMRTVQTMRDENEEKEATRTASKAIFRSTDVTSTSSAKREVKIQIVKEALVVSILLLLILATSVVNRDAQSRAFELQVSQMNTLLQTLQAQHAMEAKVSESWFHGDTRANFAKRKKKNRIKRKTRTRNINETYQNHEMASILNDSFPNLTQDLQVQEQNVLAKVGMRGRRRPRFLNNFDFGLSLTMFSKKNPTEQNSVSKELDGALVHQDRDEKEKSKYEIPMHDFFLVQSALEP